MFLAHVMDVYAAVYINVLYSLISYIIHKNTLMISILQIFASQLQLSRSPLCAILECVKVAREGEPIAKKEARFSKRVKTF